MVLQSTFTSQQEHVKFCLAAEGFGSKLCRLESTSNRKVKGFMSVRPGCSSSSPLLPVTLCQSLFCINNQQTCEMVQIKTKQLPQKLKIFELYRNTELLDLFFYYPKYLIWPSVETVDRYETVSCPFCPSHVCQNVPPDLSICGFILSQCLSVRALQETLAHTEHLAAEVTLLSFPSLKKIWIILHLNIMEKQ